MEEKDVIDVEVVESEVEIIADQHSDEIISEPVPHFSDDEIDIKVASLINSLKEENENVSEASFALAKEIANNTKDFLDNNTYLWVMYAYALHYRKTSNKNAERFCYIRMKNILDAEKGKEHKPKALTFNQNTLTEAIKEEVEAQTAFMKDVIANIKRQFFMMEAVILTIFVFILLFLLNYDIMTTIMFTVIVGLFNFFFTFRRLKNKFLVNQTNTSKSYCEDEVLIQFDLPIANS